MQGTKVGSSMPPPVQVEQATEKPAESLRPGWTHKSFKTGAEAASFLSLSNQQPLPTEIYATLGVYFHVWWKPTQSGFKYSYSYIPWDEQQAQNVPLPGPKATQVPIGFGTTNGRRVFLFFDARK
jgi:hypothetical protein